MATNRTYQPKAGVQKPEKYSSVGPNYLKYGEQPGFIYFPQHDRYYVDPKSVKTQYEQEGLIQQPPSLTDQLTPVAAVAGSTVLASELAKQAVPAAKGLLGLGESGAAATEGAKAGLETFGPEMGADYGTNLVLPDPTGGGSIGLAEGAGAAPAYVPAAVALSTILAGRYGLRNLQGKTKNWKDASVADNVGRGLLAMGTFGGSEAYNKFFGGRKSTKEKEAGRWANTPLADTAKELAGKDYFAGTGGEQSRDEKFLTPDAIRVNPDNYNNIPDWDKWSKADQDKFLSGMLTAGKVQEKKGGIYYDDEYAKQLAEQIRAGTAGVVTPGTAQAQQTPQITQVNPYSNKVNGLLGLIGG